MLDQPTREKMKSNIGQDRINKWRCSSGLAGTQSQAKSVQYHTALTLNAHLDSTAQASKTSNPAQVQEKNSGAYPADVTDHQPAPATTEIPKPPTTFAAEVPNQRRTRF